MMTASSLQSRPIIISSSQSKFKQRNLRPKLKLPNQQKHNQIKISLWELYQKLKNHLMLISLSKSLKMMTASSLKSRPMIISSSQSKFKQRNLRHKLKLPNQQKHNQIKISLWELYQKLRNHLMLISLSKSLKMMRASSLKSRPMIISSSQSKFK